MFKGKSFKVGFTKGFNFYAPDTEECVRELLLQSVVASSRYDHLKVRLISVFGDFYPFLLSTCVSGCFDRMSQSGPRRVHVSAEWQ